MLKFAIYGHIEGSNTIENLEYGRPGDNEIIGYFFPLRDKRCREISNPIPCVRDEGTVSVWFVLM